MTIHHFILTRFNLLIWVKDKTGKEFDRELWLQKRLELFETFCLPSLTSQTCKEFTWILLVDAETPQPYRNRIMSYRDVCKQIVIIPVRREGGLQFAKIMGEVVRKQLVERNASSNDLCLTTYLDNDDCLHNDYVAKVQELSRQRFRSLAGNVSQSRSFSLSTMVCNITQSILSPQESFIQTIIS